MRQGSNTILLLEVPDVDLTGKRVFATFKTLSSVLFTKTEPELFVSAHEIAVRLTQEDTLKFPEGPIQVQIRWIDADGYTGCSDSTSFNVEGVMLREIISYGEGGI